MGVPFAFNILFIELLILVRSDNADFIMALYLFKAENADRYIPIFGDAIFLWQSLVFIFN